MDWDHVRMEKWRERVGGNLRKAGTHLLTFCKWLAFSVAAGLGIGRGRRAVPLQYRRGRGAFQGSRLAALAAAGGGALIALAYKLCRWEKDRGTNLC